MLAMSEVFHMYVLTRERIMLNDPRRNFCRARWRHRPPLFCQQMLIPRRPEHCGAIEEMDSDQGRGIELHSSNSISHAIESLILKRRIAKYGNVISLSGYRVQLDSNSEKLWKRLSPILREAWRKPPVIHDLAKELRLEPKKLEQSLVPLIKAGLILRPIKNRYFLPETLEDLKNDIFKSADSSKEVSVKSYRDLTGIGRNLSIEILEYFDRQGVTRRIGDTRQIIE